MNCGLPVRCSGSDPPEPRDTHKYPRESVLGIFLQCDRNSARDGTLDPGIRVEVKSDVRRCGDELIELLRRIKRPAFKFL